MQIHSELLMDWAETKYEIHSYRTEIKSRDKAWLEHLFFNL